MTELPGSAFGQLLEFAPDAIIGIDGAGAIVLANHQAEAIFEYERSELIGRPVELLVPERFHEVHPGHRSGYFADPRTRPMGAGLELYGRRRDGSEFPAEISLSSIDLGESRLGIAAVRDISERMRAQRMFEQLLESAPDAIVGVGPGGEIVLVNHQAEALFGHTRDELVGHPVEMLVPERYRGVHPSHRTGYFQDPVTRPMGAGVELVAVRRDGSEFPAEISLSSIETDGGVVAVAAVRDLTERAESERERALAEELNQTRRLESVGQLAGGIAHDFNNLLGVIINYSKFVADRLPSEDQRAREDIEEVRNAARRAADLTRQLLIFSRREVVRPQVLDLNKILGGLENLLRRALGERVQLELRLAADLPAIEADPGQIEQVLVNLAVNGRDAMPEGGRLLVETAHAGGEVRFTVSDTGVGMDAETRLRAFEPFFTTKPKGEGTGLGLATVYGIVTQAGGRIDLYSEPGMGTSVKVQLPASSQTPDDLLPTRSDAPTGSGELVLVVEDEPEVRRMTERILADGGYATLVASGGEHAVALAAEASVDLVLTDLIMPGMLGTELVERLRDERPDLRVVFMSGFSHAILAHETVANSPSTAFIEKPFTGDELLRTLRDILDRPAAEAAT